MLEVLPKSELEEQAKTARYSVPASEVNSFGTRSIMFVSRLKYSCETSSLKKLGRDTSPMSCVIRTTIRARTAG